MQKKYNPQHPFILAKTLYTRQRLKIEVNQVSCVIIILHSDTGLTFRLNNHMPHLHQIFFLFSRRLRVGQNRAVKTESEATWEFSRTDIRKWYQLAKTFTFSSELIFTMETVTEDVILIWRLHIHTILNFLNVWTDRITFLLSPFSSCGFTVKQN